jgi:hypothetical protein
MLSLGRILIIIAIITVENTGATLIQGLIQEIMREVEEMTVIKWFVSHDPERIKKTVIENIDTTIMIGTTVIRKEWRSRGVIQKMIINGGKEKKKREKLKRAVDTLRPIETRVLCTAGMTMITMQISKSLKISRINFLGETGKQIWLRVIRRR